MENRTYFFHPEKKVVKQGFLMEDQNGAVVYEAKMLKQTLLGPMIFEFVNHLSGKTGQHKVGHTVTTETSGMMEFFSVKSHFKFDGKKIWDYLHEMGVRIDSGFSGDKVGMTYRVSLKGEEVAVIASAAANGSNFFVTSSFAYNVTAAEKDLDLAFLCAFAFARTDQTFYS